jgi:cytochrome c biogenesis protein CcmG/thiol:disulfide interchange protein DsbE
MIARLLPVIAFVLLGVLLAVGLKIADHKTEIPSPLIGKPVPDFSLPILGREDDLVTPGDLLGEPYLLNVWASWCVTCRVEHPFIDQLAKSGRVRVIGLNYRDETSDALGWLQRFGDPYEFTIADISGRTAIDFGVYAAPESFLVDAEGTIVFKQIGAVTPEVIEQEILPRLEQMNSGAMGN